MMCLFHVFRPPTLSQRHMDLHVWAYPRPGYKFHRNPLRGFGAPGGQNLAFPITLAIRFYNSLYYLTSSDDRVLPVMQWMSSKPGLAAIRDLYLINFYITYLILALGLIVDSVHYSKSVTGGWHAIFHQMCCCIIAISNTVLVHGVDILMSQIMIKRVYIVNRLNSFKVNRTSSNMDDYSRWFVGILID